MLRSLPNLVCGNSDSSRKIRFTQIAFQELTKVKKAAVVEVKTTSPEMGWGGIFASSSDGGNVTDIYRVGPGKLNQIVLYSKELSWQTSCSLKPILLTIIMKCFYTVLMQSQSSRNATTVKENIKGDCVLISLELCQEVFIIWRYKKNCITYSNE